MEKEQRKRTEMISYLQDAMEETFQCTCREIQTALDMDACRIWHGFRDAVCELKQACWKNCATQMRPASLTGSVIPMTPWETGR